MIHVIATIELAEGTRDAFLAEFHKIVPLVRAEAGCQEYGPTVDVAGSGIALQAAPRDHVVTIIEKWDTLEALHAHLKAPHMAVYRPRVKDMVVSTKLHILQPA
jgi:quinol monooxygenase YgiN